MLTPHFHPKEIPRSAFQLCRVTLARLGPAKISNSMIEVELSYMNCIICSVNKWSLKMTNTRSTDLSWGQLYSSPWDVSFFRFTDSTTNRLFGVVVGFGMAKGVPKDNDLGTLQSSSWFNSRMRTSLYTRVHDRGVGREAKEVEGNQQTGVDSTEDLKKYIGKN